MGLTKDSVRKMIKDELKDHKGPKPAKPEKVPKPDDGKAEKAA